MVTHSLKIWVDKGNPEIRSGLVIIAIREV